jgi:hypothetical protein
LRLSLADRQAAVDRCPASPPQISAVPKSEVVGMMGNNDEPGLLRTVERDLRLDLFRGVGLWMIFLDHIPHDVVAWLTLRNYGFSDAAEFFVISPASFTGRSCGAAVFSPPPNGC